MTHSSLNIAGAQPMRCAPHRQQAGFTLIEIMIVVLIVGVLMAIAYPSYQNHVINTRRAVAATCLMEAAQFAERYRTTKLTYVGARTEFTTNVRPNMQCAKDLTGHYDIDFAADPAATTFSLNATPQGRQASRDTKCGTLSLSQSGAKSVSVSGTSATACF